MMACRYADVLAQFHDEEHLIKFEELLEAAIDLDKIPDEYLICASYDAGLQVQAFSLCQASMSDRQLLLWCSDAALMLYCCLTLPSCYVATVLHRRCQVH